MPKSLALPVLILLSFLAPTSADAAVEEVIAGLSQPVRLVAPAGDDRLFVVERIGRIRIFDQAGTELGTFLDIRDSTTTFSERGLLGLAFAPDYGTTGRFYIHYTDLAGDTRIVRLTVDGSDPNLADLATHEVLLSVSQPEANHNGGHLEFGPDGMLYVGLGDGGGGGDPGDNAQDDQTLLGKMLRLDVSGPTGYAVPVDNPFVDQAPLDEIWAKGLRNPWCFSFDRLTGDLYIADVGQGKEEEIDIQPSDSIGGENYGWRLMEGTRCYNPATGCNDGTLTLPVHTYPRGGDPFRCSISGGYVYRGTRIPSLLGQYFYADYCSYQIWSFSWTPQGGLGAVTERTAEMTPAGGYESVASFGQDGLGELYVLDLYGGTVHRIVGAVGDVPGSAPGSFLHQNVPNPFNPVTEIKYALLRDGTVRLDIFDVQGRLVIRLVDANQAVGPHVVTWNGLDAGGQPVSSGTYFYRMTTDEHRFIRKMTLAR